ncbi:hypothetical protein V5O48_016507, partial [Marasmius crinis-equi]
LNIRTDFRRTMLERNRVLSSMELDPRSPRVIRAASSSDDGYKSDFSHSPPAEV